MSEIEETCGLFNHIASDMKVKCIFLSIEVTLPSVHIFNQCLVFDFKITNDKSGSLARRMQAASVVFTPCHNGF